MKYTYTPALKAFMKTVNRPYNEGYRICDNIAAIGKIEMLIQNGLIEDSDFGKENEYESICSCGCLKSRGFKCDFCGGENEALCL